MMYLKLKRFWIECEVVYVHKICSNLIRQKEKEVENAMNQQLQLMDTVREILIELEHISHSG